MEYQFRRGRGYVMSFLTAMLVNVPSLTPIVRLLDGAST
jgi:hypothetical protein